VPAPLNLFEPRNDHFGSSWPSVSKTLGALPRKQGSRESCPWEASC
jgi:hypothetical protein